MSKPSEEDIKKLKEYLEERIEKLKELRIRADTRYKTIPDSDKDSFMNSKWSWGIAVFIFYELEEIWGLLQAIVDNVIETETKTDTLKQKLERLNAEVEAHKPAVQMLKTAIEFEEKTLRKNR